MHGENEKAPCVVLVASTWSSRSRGLPLSFQRMSLVAKFWRSWARQSRETERAITSVFFELVVVVVVTLIESITAL